MFLGAARKLLILYINYVMLFKIEFFLSRTGERIRSLILYQPASMKGGPTNFDKLYELLNSLRKQRVFLLELQPYWTVVSNFIFLEVKCVDSKELADKGWKNTWAMKSNIEEIE